MHISKERDPEHTRKKRDGIRTAEHNRRDQVAAIVPGAVSFERANRSRYSRRALLNWERPPCTERKSLNKECGWKDGDRGGPAQTEGIPRKEREKRERHT